MALLENNPAARGQLFFTDDFAAYEKILPRGAHFASKTLTQRAESINANIRHYVARFHRKTRCTTKCPKMAHLSVMLFSRKKQMLGIVG